MLHSQYLRVGANVEIPELLGFVPAGNQTFIVKGVFAGGMGVCVHLRHVGSGTEYALKGVLPDHIDDQATVDRFLDELQVWLAASSCSLIAEAIAVVRINETPCVLATWMPHGDLAHALPRLGKKEKIETLLRMVRGLSWVQNNLGVIHRDLKPSNVLLDGNDLGYVADWGLARPTGLVMRNLKKSLDAQSFDRPDRTQVGSFLGTVMYAAPEQIMGNSHIDHRADIYALGCMMFEFETGSPPFDGKTLNEVVQRQLQEKPQKLGGWFKRTELGLERVISRCLEKKPTDRFSTYEDLEGALIDIADHQGVRLDRCVLRTRYVTSPIGTGQIKQDALIVGKSVKATTDLILIEADAIAQFLEESSNLMALGRYVEAQKLLHPYVAHDQLPVGQGWMPPHSIALNYALCHIKTGRSHEIVKLFQQLDCVGDKPPEFYVNYSLLMLTASSWKESAEICWRGLSAYPRDPDIQGNLTIALANGGDIDGAADSAMQRIKIRRDIHAIEEAAGVLQRQAIQKRDTDLPRAIEIAKLVGDLIKEGMALSPRHYLLRIKEIQLRRFAYDERAVLAIAQEMIDSDECPLTFRQMALCEMIEKLSEGKSFEAALDLIQRAGQSDPARLQAVKMRTLARHRMIGKETQNGKRVVIAEVRDYFLQLQPSGYFRDPVMAAEMQDWFEDAKSATQILQEHLSESPHDWEGIKLLAMIHLRQGCNAQAVDIAQLLVKNAPWRAESYDWLAHVAKQSCRQEIAMSAVARGNEIFEKENQLYSELRACLD